MTRRHSGDVDADTYTAEACAAADTALDAWENGRNDEARLAAAVAQAAALAGIALRLEALRAERDAPPGADYLADLDRLAQAHEPRRSRRQ